MSTKTQVLVVDDEAAILRFLKPALEANGYELTSAGSVAEATKHIAAHSPDIVLLDLGLPDGDGKDVIGREAVERTQCHELVETLRERAAAIAASASDAVQVSGPAPAFIAKRGDRWRFNVVLRGADPVRLLDPPPGVPWSIDVDPETLL